MTVRIDPNGVVKLLGVCPGEDAEPLLRHLLQAPGMTVDWRECRAAHMAVVQVLLAARPKLRGPPADARLRAWVEPLLAHRRE